MTLLEENIGEMLHDRDYGGTVQVRPQKRQSAE